MSNANTNCTHTLEYRKWELLPDGLCIFIDKQHMSFIIDA